MKGLVGMVAVLAIAWVLVGHGKTQNAPAMGSLSRGSQSDRLRSLVARRAPAVFGQWEVDFSRKMPGVQR